MTPERRAVYARAAADLGDRIQVAAGRPEDRNARQTSAAFGDGATLAELERFIGALREAGAPDDCHPEVSANERNEIVYMVGVTRRTHGSSGGSRSTT